MSDLSVATTSDNSELIKSQNGDGKLGSDSSCCTNNNSIPPHEISSEELELLKKLEEQNRYLFIYLFICAREKQIERTDEFERNSDVQMYKTGK